jgi:hypothetical protein
VEPNQTRGGSLVEVAIDGLPDVLPKLLQSHSLGEYGLSQGASGITAVRRVFN